MGALDAMAAVARMEAQLGEGPVRRVWVDELLDDFAREEERGGRAQLMPEARRSVPTSTTAAGPSC